MTIKAINQKRLAYLFEAVRLGTVRAAADKLNIAPSAVSRQIALLEEELACTLIERHRRGVTATEAGDVLLRYHRESLAFEEDCIAELQALQGLQHGHVKLAVGEGFVGDLMAGPLPAFSRDYPGIKIGVTLGGSSSVVRMVEEDEAHIGLLFHPATHSGIRSQAISAQAICAVLAPDHPLAACDTPLQLAELIDYPVALPESDFGVCQLLALAEFEARVRFNPTLTTNSIAVLKQFARAGMGFTFLPAFVVAREIEDGQLLALAIDHPVLQNGEAHMITRVGRKLPESAFLLLQHLTEWMKAFAARG